MTKENNLSTTFVQNHYPQTKEFQAEELKTFDVPIWTDFFQEEIVQEEEEEAIDDNDDEMDLEQHILHSLYLEREREARCAAAGKDIFNF